MALLSKQPPLRYVNKIVAVGIMAIALSCGCDNTKSAVTPSATNKSNRIEKAAPTPVQVADNIPWRIYTINKGKHDPESGAGFRFFTADSLRFKLSFDATIRALNANSVNQLDWNKVLGFSDCFTHHQTNSARLVWRYDTIVDNITLGQYLYISGDRSFKELTKIEIGDTVKVLVYRGVGKYGFEVNGVSSTVNKTCTSKLASYWLYPYFGGDESAPQKVNVHIQHLSPRL